MTTDYARRAQIDEMLESIGKAKHALQFEDSETVDLLETVATPDPSNAWQEASDVVWQEFPIEAPAYAYHAIRRALVIAESLCDDHLADKLEAACTHLVKKIQENNG